MNVDPVSAGATVGIFLLSMLNSIGLQRVHRQVKSPNGATTGEAVQATKHTTDSVEREIKAARSEARSAAHRAEEAAKAAKDAAELARASNSIAADAAARLGEFLREWDRVDPDESKGRYE